MNEFVVGDLFNSQADVIVIPFDSKGSIATSFFNGLKKLHAPTSFSEAKFLPGDLKIHTVNSKAVKYIIYACTVDDFRSSYAVIRSIARKLGTHMNTFRRITNRRVNSIACPVLGSRSGNLDPATCHNILRNGFYETAETTIQFDVYTLEPYSDNMFLVSNKLSSQIALEAMLLEVIDNQLIRQLTYDETYYYELAENCFREFMDILSEEPIEFFFSNSYRL